jgi:hypothetical protein
MENQNWKYRPTHQIQSFKDLKIEQQKLAIYQKFLGELLGKDKEQFKISLQAKNLLASLLSALSLKTEETCNNSSLLGSNFIMKIVKWIIKAFFR